MKKLFKFIGVCCLSAVLAMAMGIGMMLVTDNDGAIIDTMFFGGVLIALALGAFSGRKKNTYYQA